MAELCQMSSDRKSSPVLALSNTRQMILNIVLRSQKPISAVDIRDELKKREVEPRLNDIRRHLSSLCTRHLKKHYDESLDCWVYQKK